MKKILKILLIVLMVIFFVGLWLVGILFFVNRLNLQSDTLEEVPVQEEPVKTPYSFFDEPTFNRYDELTQFYGWKTNYYFKNTQLIWFYQDQRNAIYNAVLDQTVLEVEGEGQKFGVAQFENGVHIFWHINSQDNTITLYQANGQAVFTKDYEADKDPLPKLFFDLVFYGGEYYRTDSEGNLQFAFRENPMVPATGLGITTTAAGYYYKENGTSVFVYDNSMKQIAYYRPPSFATTPEFVILDDGNLLVQYRIPLLDDAQEYDLLIGTQKYDLVSLLFNVEDQQKRELELDYVIYDSESRSRSDWRYTAEFGCFDDDVINLIYAFQIENKQINASEAILYAISNDGAVQKRLNDWVPCQGCHLPVAVSPTRYTLLNDIGQRFLLDQSGNILFELHKSAIVKETYIYFNNAIYDHELNLLYEFGEPMNVRKAYDECLLLYATESGDVYLFAEGECTPLIQSKKGAVLYLYEREGYFYTENPGTRNDYNHFTFFNDKGKRILRFSDRGSPGIAEIDDGILIVTIYDSEYSGKGSYKHFRFS